MFFVVFFFKKFYREYNQCQTVWIQFRPDGPDLDPNCLQLLSVADTSRQKVNDTQQISLRYSKSDQHLSCSLPI